MDEILNLIESVSEDFPSYSYKPSSVLKTMNDTLTHAKFTCSFTGLSTSHEIIVVHILIT